ARAGGHGGEPEPGVMRQQRDETLPDHAGGADDAHFVLFAHSTDLPFTGPVLFLCQMPHLRARFCTDNKKTGLKTGTKCNIISYCMHTAQHTAGVTVPRLFGRGPRPVRAAYRLRRRTLSLAPCPGWALEKSKVLMRFAPLCCVYYSIPPGDCRC